MEHLLNDCKDLPNQHENIHKLCDEMGQPVLSLTESQWKLRQIATLSEFTNGWKAIVEQSLASEEINKSKRAGL